jgi:hypothetical protein
MGDKPYPITYSGANLRANRQQLLKSSAIKSTTKGLADQQQTKAFILNSKVSSIANSSEVSSIQDSEIL